MHNTKINYIMKNSVKILMLVTLSVLFFESCKKETKTPEKVEEITVTTTEKAPAKIEKTSFKINGMTCAMGCAKVIETKLSGLEGVQKAAVDFDGKTATIEFDSNIQSPEKLMEVVEAVADGKTYTVEKIK